MAKPVKQATIETDISRTWKIILTSILFLYLTLSYCQQQNMLTADLGRHIRNGEYFLQHHEPITTNYYSYTEPEFLTRTHHWGAGVIYYALHKMGGFGALGLLNVLLYMGAFFLFFKISLEKSNYIFSIFFSLLAVPLITWRLEIRPEVFSYLFIAIYYFLLSRFTDEKLKWQYLLILPFIQILWVNIHILFPIGPFLIAVFAFGELINKKNEHLKKLILLFGLSSIASLVNYFGINGIIEPFTILNNYGMMIAENMSVWFMQGRFPDKTIYYHVEFVILISLVVIGLLVWTKKIKQYIALPIITVVFGILAWKMIRNLPLLGFLFIPLSVISLFEFQKMKSIPFQKNTRLILIVFSCFILLSGFALPTITYLQHPSYESYVSSLKALEKEYKRNPSQKDAINQREKQIKQRYADVDNSMALRNYYSPYKQYFGLGLMEGCNKSAEFILKNNVEGPYFNNYDIGGYFIFYLFPQYKPFVDNRPEAYSVDFFQDLFIPMQQDTTDATWKKADEKYHFNSIYFYRHDQTPYGQPFLIRRIKDAEWIPIYFDDYTVLLLRNNEKNAFLLQQYALDKRMFVSTPN